MCPVAKGRAIRIGSDAQIEPDDAGDPRELHHGDRGVQRPLDPPELGMRHANGSRHVLETEPGAHPSEAQITAGRCDQPAPDTGSSVSGSLLGTHGPRMMCLANLPRIGPRIRLCCDAHNGREQRPLRRTCMPGAQSRPIRG
jgi:hypothetical protein